MYKKLIISIVAFILLLILSGVITFYVLVNKKPEKVESIIKKLPPTNVTTGYMPEVLSSSFDPTKNMGTYNIKSLNENTNKFGVIRLFPEDNTKSIFFTELKCETGINYKETDGQTKKITVDELRLFLEDNKSNLLISAFCDDTKCSSLVGTCMLINNSYKVSNDENI